ncbi:hypothetical protein LEP1GSC192_2859 [Leptospira sp. B5-022]|nr:hypothetical protein LEP1GSC192_2859 [Leptospira sp. B5-022]
MVSHGEKDREHPIIGALMSSFFRDPRVQAENKNKILG